MIKVKNISNVESVPPKTPIIDFDITNNEVYTHVDDCIIRDDERDNNKHDDNKFVINNKSNQRL